MGGEFGWDSKKARGNRRKHRGRRRRKHRRGIEFEEASEVLKYDRMRRRRFDEEHSTPEDERWVTIGRSLRGRTLIVVHSDEDKLPIRIISAREATHYERQRYEEG